MEPERIGHKEPKAGRAAELAAVWNRKSWVDGADYPSCGFPLQSLPYCVFRGEDGRGCIGVGIGGSILDLKACSSGGLFAGLPDSVLLACSEKTLNSLIGCEAADQDALRGRLMDLLGAAADAATRQAVLGALRPMPDAVLLKPVNPANYTDFYASIHHATRVGRLFRPDQPLLPNYKYVPIGYHGRASSVVVSGTAVRRPCGQTKAGQDPTPAFGPSRRLDYEVEVGAYIARDNPLGEPAGIAEAGERLFGISLLNDWSARDIQAWEYQPLGPFLAKSFATSVSPWVVPMAALAPFRVAAARPERDPAPLGYLWSGEDQAQGAIDLTLEAFLLTPRMRAEGLEPFRLSRANLLDLYWTPAQLVAHHASNGCNLLAGDLLGTGTVSGPAEDSAGCLLELTEGGVRPVRLPTGETRSWLEDGDEVILRGVCRRAGFPDVSLGECRGAILPAL